jgi:hypothetical protein
MGMPNWSLVFLAILSLSSSAQAADVEGLAHLFKQEFVSGYESGRCQYNTRFFTAKAQSQGIDLEGALYITIEGYGDISYYHGRTKSGQAPSSGIWFHHYFLIVPSDGVRSPEFSPERNYIVIDFDFGNTPKLVDLKTYLSEMFMSPSVRNDPSKIETTFDLGLIKLTAHDVTKLIEEINPSGEFTSAAEARATQFKDIKFREFYRKL